MENSINNLINLNNSYKALLKELEGKSEIIEIHEAINLFVNFNILKSKIEPYRFLKMILKSKFSDTLYERYKDYIPSNLLYNYVYNNLFIYFNDCLNIFFKDIEPSLYFSDRKNHAVEVVICDLLHFLNIQSSSESKLKILIDDALHKVFPYVEEFILVFNSDHPERKKEFNFLSFGRFLMVKILELENNFEADYPRRDFLFLPDIINRVEQDFPCREKPISRDKIINLINLAELRVYNVPRMNRLFDPNSNPSTWCNLIPCIKEEDFEKISNILKNFSDKEIRKMSRDRSIKEIAELNYDGDVNSYYRNIINKRNNTVYQRYGGYDILFEKVKEGLMKKYGTFNINNLEWKKEKTKKTVLTKYGTSHISQSDFFKKKIKDTYKTAQQKDLERLQSLHRKTFYDFKSLAQKFEYKNPSDVRTIAKKIGITIYKTPHGSYLDEDGVKELEDHLSSFMSSGEFFISKFLGENHIKFFYNKRFENCKDIHVLPFDFYLPDYNLCIEYQGKQHFEDIPFLSCKHTKLKPMKNPSSLEDRQRKDNIKRNFCKENNIKLIEPAYYHTHDEIKKMILEAIAL